MVKFDYDVLRHSTTLHFLSAFRVVMIVMSDGISLKHHADLQSTANGVGVILNAYKRNNLIVAESDFIEFHIKFLIYF